MTVEKMNIAGCINNEKLKVLVLALAIHFNSSIGIAVGNTLLPKYCHRY